MKRPIFYWQETLFQLGRRVVWRNKAIHRSRNEKRTVHNTKRLPTSESLEPRHLMAGLPTPLAPESNPTIPRTASSERRTTMARTPKFATTH